MQTENQELIEFTADYIRVRQTVDGSFVITLGVGEYQVEEMAKILKISIDKNLIIKIGVRND